MSPDRWDQIQDLYHSARERKPEERSAYLKQACNGDEALQREVGTLLAQEEQAHTFLETDEPGTSSQSIETSVAPGERIGPYLVLEFLQKGGMGEVYKARDVRLDRTVAIKFLPHAYAEDADALERFEREVRAASALNHPRICTVYDVGDHQGRPFYVMEFLEGQSLRDRIADKPMPIPEVVDLGMQIADGLQAAHAKGIIHRDIKPANIFVTSCGQAKILDFGIAKRVTKPHSAPVSATAAQNATSGASIDMTRPGSLRGTVAYLSPEQARGEEVDTRTDIFSFGIVLYQMATGQLAFRGETAEQLIHAILHQAPVKPSVLNPSVPATLDRIILKTLEKDRATRYQSTGDLLADLSDLQQTGRRRSIRTAWITAVVAVSALAAALVFAINLSKYSGVPEIVQRQLTSNSINNSVYFAAIAGDGKQLAYTDLQGVHIRAIDTGEVSHITLPPGFCFR
jgi:serine/threonine protein kinase